MDHIETLIATAKALNPLQIGFLDGVVADMATTERELLGQYLDYCLTTGVDLEFLAESYDLLVKDMLREQIYFRRHRCYRYSTYAEVADSVYMNPDYMTKYMHGLALSYFLWPNHVQLRHYFASTLPAAQGGRYLEVGPGHGFYMMSAMRSSAYQSFTGIDISPTSVALTRQILSSPIFGTFANWQLVQGDFFTFKVETPYDALVTGEVLEHVEDPARFLRRIREITHGDSHIFLTTCINSPALDHIYLFSAVDELAAMFGDCGLRIRDQLLLPHVGTTLAEAEANKLPVNVAFVLGH